MILEKVFKYNIKHVYVSVHFKSGLFQNYIDNSRFKNKLTCVIEPNPLVTGGAVNYVIENTSISSPLFVLNGDSISKINLKTI